MNREFEGFNSGLRGHIEVPGDKSITHRAFIFGSMGRGKARVENVSPSADCQSTITCLSKAGARIERTGQNSYILEGIGRFGFKEPDDVLFAGNSGTTARILPSIFAAQSFSTFITGDDSLRRRPMNRIIEPLQIMGAQITAREKGQLLPIAIKGTRLKGADISISMASAQVKTALIIAGLLAEGNSTVSEPAASRDHTERMLLAAGASINKYDNSITVQPGDIQTIGMNIPGDISSAAFFIVAASCIKNSELALKNVGLNPTRTGIIELLKNMNANIMIDDSIGAIEPAGNLTVKHSQLAPFRVDKTNAASVIDELPILAVAATQANGRSEIRDAGELRYKESDRISAMYTELKKMGARVEELPDGLIIDGPVKLKGTIVDSNGDHRVAMSLAIAGLIAEGKTIVQNFECIDISYPQFYEDLVSLVRA